MACSMKLDLESKVESAVHHLKMSMKWKEAGDPKYELGELRVMACSKELLVRAVFSPIACMDVPFLVGRSR